MSPVSSALRDDALLLLESMAEAVVASDASGRFLFFNAKAERLIGMGAIDAPPETWPERYGLFLPDRVTLFRAEDLPMARATRGLATAEIEIFIRNDRIPDGVFVGATGAPLFAPDGSVRAGVVVMRDITDRIQLRERLDRTLALTAVLQEVASASNEAATAEQSFQRALDAITGFSHWPVGFAYRINQDGDALVFAGALRADHARHARLISETATRRFHAGEGLPGRVLASGRPEEVEDLRAQADDRRMQLAAQIGLRAMIAFPILSGDHVTGALEFGCDGPIALGDDFRRLMQQVGMQLGRVAERERAREREHFFFSTLDHVAHPIFVKDRRFRWVFLNAAFCDLVGYPREELLLKSDYDFFPRQEADFFRQKDREMFETGRTVDIDEEPITDAAGRRHVLATTKVPLFGRHGEITHLVGIIHDITRMKAAEEQARQLAVERAAREAAEQGRRRAQFLAEASRILSGSLMAETTIRRVARAALPVLGDWCVVSTLGEDGALHVATVAHAELEPDAALAACVETALAEGHALTEVERVVASGRPELQADVHADLLGRLCGADIAAKASCGVAVHSYLCVPLVTRQHTLGAMSMARSTTPGPYGPEDLALAEELARRTAIALDNAALYQQAQEAILVRDEFLQAASHELRTPLTSLKMQVQHLTRTLKGCEAEPRIHRGVVRIERQVDRLSLLILNLLDVSSLTARRLELSRTWVDLAFIVREVTSHFTGDLVRAHSELQLDVVDTAVGFWDGARLQQVVTNLLSNAIKFSAGTPIELSLTADDELARLVITDHGIGIADEDVQRIFGRFERAVSSRHYGGLGLGLFLSREIIEAHGGLVRVESAHGKGSRFTVILPRRARPIAANETAAPA